MRALYAIWVSAMTLALFSLTSFVMFGVWAMTSPAFPAEVSQVERLNDLTNSANFVLGDGEGWCSGTLISVKYRLVATANHCIDQLLGTKAKKRIGPHGEIDEVQIEDRKNITLTQRDYSDHDLVSSRSWMARIVDYDAAGDSAVLQIQRKDIPQKVAVELLPPNRKVLPGESVWLIGNPAMMDNTIMKGIISNITRRLDVGGTEYNYYQFQAAIVGGISGGAMLTDDLYYAGTVAAGLRGSDLSMAVPVEQLRKLLKRSCFASVVADTPQNRDGDAKCRGRRSLQDDGSPKTLSDDDTSNDYTRGGPH